jgi:hypothetical protein
MGAWKSGRSWRSTRASEIDRATIEESFRRDAGRAIAALSRVLRDLDRVRQAAVACVVFAGLALQGALPSQAEPVWIGGTASVTAHDKAIAHDLAYRAAVSKADETCYGAHGGVAEVKASYEYLSASDEWRVQVTIRETCNVDYGRD